MCIHEMRYLGSSIYLVKTIKILAGAFDCLQHKTYKKTKRSMVKYYQWRRKHVVDCVSRYSSEVVMVNVMDKAKQVSLYFTSLPIPSIFYLFLHVLRLDSPTKYKAIVQVFKQPARMRFPTICIPCAD